MNRSHRLASANFAVAIASFGLAALLGLVQALTIAGIELPGVTPDIYYLSVTAHGVLMALVFTTFFIMGLGYLIARERLGFIVGEKVAWTGFWLALIPPVMLAYAESGAGLALIVFLGYVLINGSVQNIVQPKLMGDQLNLSPLVVVASLFIWTWILGPIGALIAVPMAVPDVPVMVPWLLMTLLSPPPNSILRTTCHVQTGDYQYA